MRAGEQDALAGQLVQAWARDVGVTIDTKVSPKVVPMHDQHVVTSPVRYVVPADRRHLLRLLGSVDGIRHPMLRYNRCGATVDGVACTVLARTRNG